MKIKKVIINSRKRCFEIETARGILTLPFARLDLKPSLKDKIKAAYVDSELGNEAITYIMSSGKEDSIHLDVFLHYNRDPDYHREITLHKLTVDAITQIKRSGISKHEIVRRLKTSPSQLYRLLDPANYKKSVDEMMRLLAVLGYRVDMTVVKEVPEDDAA
ncbi:MAG TPA: hypothetical protein DCS07_07150 [Bdellovibrionales bacterium]|nr:MAG: hypothetical protein A2Z97_01090 [Bdellovibrionales bacterium GWB1_52_6]OFZ03599.1 MAG: hypothetical protein A2X97_00705 [Bdellovibrionales bacterium GWA1_52_35]OFZ34945.1 MAG: hypothetical protein A2070_14515 [Bdellovibrionales bacterium GWC1_52_8]HAR42396.1 hypothetical protein [Bdellovibrionales bacterium]HCM38917.1 hypothetical protein [Bdellovibrionales bacterium]